MTIDSSEPHFENGAISETQDLMTAKNKVRRGRCQDNLRDFNQRNRENAICGYEIAWKGTNLIKISWFYRMQKQWGIHMETYYRNIGCWIYVWSY